MRNGAASTVLTRLGTFFTVVSMPLNVSCVPSGQSSVFLKKGRGEVFISLRGEAPSVGMRLLLLSAAPGTTVFRCKGPRVCYPVVLKCMRRAVSAELRTPGTWSPVSFGLGKEMEIFGCLTLRGTLLPVASMPSNAACSLSTLSSKCLVDIFPSTRGVAPSVAVF